MKTTHFTEWSELRKYIDDLILSVDLEREKQKRYFSPLLFRGHGNADWALQTTLDRAGENEMPVHRYYRLAASAHRYIGNFAAKQISITDLADLKFDYDSLHQIPNYEFLAYLRHHGFPSPLLDWSTSPYVAAYFALCDVSTTSEEAAIFVYQEYAGGGKGSSSQKGTIRLQGPWAAIHQRHVMQQSWYSVCIKETSVDSDATSVFCSYDKVDYSTDTAKYPRQDLMLKLVLPTNQRSAVLKDLFRMNITPYSLFHTEDALMKTVAFKLFNNIV